MGSIETKVRECEAQMLRVTMDGHAYLFRHGKDENKERHSIELKKLNEQYRNITGKYYTFRHCENCGSNIVGEGRIADKLE